VLHAPSPERPDDGFGAAVCRAIRDQVGKLGLDIGSEPVWEQTVFRSQTDPFSQEKSLVGTWSGGQRYGTVTCFPDGRVFAEYQILLPHPELNGYFVEAVQVWGRPEALRGEAVIVEYPK
jgi:hypothetical protein